MWLLIFLCAYISAAAKLSDASSGDIIKDFRKCCPKDQALVKIVKFSDSINENYECVDSAFAEKYYDISILPLLVGARVEVHHGLPRDCMNFEMLPLTDMESELLVSEKQCYDRLAAEIENGTLKQNIPKTVKLSCNFSETDYHYNTKLNIDHIRKCCPSGQSYDMVRHVCRRTDQESDERWLIKQLNITDTYIYEVQRSIQCKRDEYAIDLDERHFSLNVDGSTLTVLRKNGEFLNRMNQGEWCIDRENYGEGLIAQVCSKNCSAYGAYCVRKCCPPGHHFRPRRCGSFVSNCVPYVDEEDFFNISYLLDPLREAHGNIFDVMGIRNSLQCPDGRYVLNRSEPQDQHQLTPEGYMETAISLTNNYCLEVFDSRHCPFGDIMVSSLLCFIRQQDTKDFRISFVVNTISSICLALTLIVYVTIPELRNLHGRNLICHVSMMLLACSCLARVQYSKVLDNLFCTTIGYCIYFGFVAAFAWLNVMCFDIWWTFGSVRTVKPLRKSSSERRRFIWYSLYAWSITLLLTGTMYLLDRYPISVHLDANIGNGVCWFASIQNAESDWPHYIYFVIPMGLFTCTNFILWMLTARHCAQVKSEVHRLQAGSVGDRVKRRFRIDRAKYILTGKLWIVMGAGWVSELISTLISQPPWLWTIVDLTNELQGVFILFILVIKPKVYYLIKKRLGLEKPDPQKNGTSSSARTSSTFLSRTISSDERANLRTSMPNNNPKQV